MAVPVYSTQLLVLSGTGEQVGSYTVPAGYVVVVTDAELFLDGEAGRNGEVYLADPAAWLIYENPGTEGATVYQWSGRAVMRPGQVLAGDCSASGSGSLWVSGYLLTTSEF